MQVSELTGMTAVSGENEHSLALKNDGTVWNWGWNYYGDLGDGTNTDRSTPVMLVTPIDITIDNNKCVDSRAISQTQAVCKLPSGTLGAKNVTVANSLGSKTLTNGYTYTGLSISSINPNNGVIGGGSTVTITGSGFDVPPGTLDTVFNPGIETNNWDKQLFIISICIKNSKTTRWQNTNWWLLCYL